jgi:tetratricopeptide (TPR) repeat protein
MRASRLGLLLEQLKALPDDTPLEEALEAVGAGEAPETAQAKRQCALVRWFDEPLYSILTSSLERRPDLQEFAAGMPSMGPGRWALDESERARLLAEWQSDNTMWRAWNLRIGEHFLQRDGADARLCAVYHLAAAPDPALVIPHFETWYREADERFDMAQCNALLEMLRLQQRFRGPSVSAVWLNWSRYFQTRMLFAEDYYKTGSYLERGELLAGFEKVLHADGEGAPWIYHIHATGGMGKTMFLRWLLSRYLAPRRILCARVDFDDFKPLNQMLDRPLRLVVRMVEQLSQQVEGLGPLLEKVNREENSPGWNAAVMDEVKLQFAGAKVQTLVVSLDTLEEATIARTGWMKDCVDELRKLRQAVPRLKLILAGRYDLAERSQALKNGEYVGYEIPRFTASEAHAYLGRRGIPEGAVRDAIVARAGEAGADPGDNPLTGRNPFKLAIFAEIALDRDLSAPEVYALPRADVAYLLERVIRKIESQPLRWMIRYGAIARHLTPEFAANVLLPPLRQALRGKVRDRPAEDLEAEYQDTWQPEPELAEQVSAADLWVELKKYARERGWISLAKVDGKDGLRFHPEVVGPTRELLLKQAIFPQLQKRASNYFEKRAAQADLGEADWVSCVREAVFHRFQMQSGQGRAKPGSGKTDGAWVYWKRQLRRAERFSTGGALKIASEVLGPDYAEAERRPLTALMTAAHLCEAHCRMASLLLREAGIRFAKGYNREEFLRHTASAGAIAAEYKLKTLPPFLRTLSQAWSADSRDATLAVLQKAIASTTPTFLHTMSQAWSADSRDATLAVLRKAIASTTRNQRFVLMLQTAQLLTERRSLEAVRLFKEALELLPAARRTGVEGAEISLELASFYAFEGEHTAVISNLGEARRQAKGKSPLVAQVLEREASYGLAVGDVDTAAARIAELAGLPAKHHSTPAARHVLEAWLALANVDPFAALAAIEAGRKVSTADLDVARLLDQEGEAEAMLLNFGAALDRFESASVRYDLAHVLTGSARCKVLSARLLAAVMRNFPEAEGVLGSALDLPGSRDAEICCELLMLKAFIARSKKNTEGFAEAVGQLLARREPPWPPHLRTRAMMFALLGGWGPVPEFLDELVETLSDVQPPTLRDRALEWSAYFWEPVKVPEQFVNRVMTLFTKSRVGSASGVRRGIARAHLMRLLGHRDTAVKLLEEAARGMHGITGESAVILEWELNEARLRLRDRTHYSELAERAGASEVRSTTLYDVIRVSAARERDESEAARGPQRLPAEPGNVFEAEKLRWLAMLPGARPEDRAGAQEYQARLGWTDGKESKQPGGVGIAIRAAGLPQPLLKAADEVDVAMGWLLRDRAGFASELSEVLRVGGVLPEVVAIEPEARVSSLPWEMASVLSERRKVYRTLASAPALALPPQPVLPWSSVLYVGPDEEMGALVESFAASSGGSIEEFYERHKANPSVLRNADPRFMLEAMQSTPEVTLIHIACTLRETSGGIYLDFEDTRMRGKSFGIAAKDTSREALDLHLSVTRVDRALQGLRTPPFVVLDVANPYNVTEAIRMLLLRNRFAAQLFAMGHVRGILGCGLASPQDRYELSQATVNALMTKSVGETLADLRRPGGSLEDLLPGMGSGLWTNNPDDRLFATGG